METLRTRAKLKVHEHAMLAVVVGQVVEDVNTLGEQLSVVGVGGVDVEDRASNRDFREGLDSDGDDDSKGAGAATLESPEEVRVLLCVGGHEFTLGGDGVEREDVVSAHAVDSGKRAVAASLNVTSGPANSLDYVSDGFRRPDRYTYWALSTNDDHLGALSKAFPVQFTALYTSTDNGRTTRPVTRPSVLLEELDVLEAVSVDDECAVTGGTTHEVVTSVSDDQTEVALPCELHTSSDLLLCSSHDDVLSVETTCAGS